MRARENRRDVELELKSKDPMEMGDDVISSEDERDWEVIVTSVEHCEPAAMSTGGEREVESYGDIPVPRKHATSSDAIGEQEAKRTRSPRPSEASPTSSPPTTGTVG